MKGGAAHGETWEFGQLHTQLYIASYIPGIFTALYKWLCMSIVMLGYL